MSEIDKLVPPMPPTHDTPTLEQRVAYLESWREDAEGQIAALTSEATSIHAAVARLFGGTGINPKPPRNCRKCGRQLTVQPGAACPVCSTSNPE